MTSDSPQNPSNSPQNLPPPPPPPSSESSSRVSAKIGSSGGHKSQFPNPPDSRNPDAATLREQWRFAIRQYSRWYSQAWGSAILAGLSFFALGWFIKGSNPLPSFKHENRDPPPPDDDTEVQRAP